MVMVAVIMRSFQRLQSSGNVDAKAAIGHVAVVYLRVPGERSGKGKITVSVDGRSHEYEAVTAGKELPTGVDCRVVRMIGNGTFEVVALEELGDEA